MLLGGVAAFGTSSESSQPPVARQTVVENLDLKLGAIAAGNETSDTYWREERFNRGDTFASLLSRLGVDPDDTSKLVKENGGSKPFRVLRPGMNVQAQTTEEGDLVSLRFMAGRETVLGFDRDGNAFKTIEEQAALTRIVKSAAGEIRSSLFAATDDADLPDGIATQIAEIFSGDIDFHRDLRRGDRFAVVYETFHHEGHEARSGRVLAAEFVNNAKVYRAVWFQDQDGQASYYTPEGKSLRKAFLRSPLEFSRVTSGFSMRFHPILQQWRQHKGVDYGAPTGTRVRATADGIIDFIGKQNGYGNTVVLRHHGSVTTLYAHLNGFPGGLTKGTRVQQGDVIGFVGATGWATGPHLHYEFRVGAEHRNPLTVAMPAAEPVPAHRLAAFKSETRAVTAYLDSLADISLAALE